MSHPYLGVNPEHIDNAEQQLSIKFPDKLRLAWENYNLIELRGGWFVFPIFDEQNPRKTCGHVVYENNHGWHDLQPDNTIAIADNGSGNQLIMKVKDGVVEDCVYYWNHETGKMIEWKPGLQSILNSALKSRANVEKLFNKYKK